VGYGALPMSFICRSRWTFQLTPAVLIRMGSCVYYKGLDTKHGNVYTANVVAVNVLYNLRSTPLQYVIISGGARRKDSS
jgi:hypothetical protein